MQQFRNKGAGASRPPARSGGGRRPAPSSAYTAGMKFAEGFGMAPSNNYVPRREAPRGRPARGGSSSRPSSGGRSDSRGGSRGGFSQSPRSGGGKRNTQEMRVDLSQLVNKAKPIVEEDAFVSTHSFADFKIDDRLKANIIAKGYITPTPIQDESIPYR